MIAAAPPKARLPQEQDGSVPRWRRPAAQLHRVAMEQDGVAFRFQFSNPPARPAVMRSFERPVAEEWA